MSRFLTDIPPAFAWLILAAVFNVYALAVFTIAVRAKQRYRLEHEQDLASVVFGGVGAAYGLLLALVVATLWNNFTTVQNNVYAEASQLQLLHGDITAMQGPAEEYQRMLAGYGHELLTIEIPRMCSRTPVAWSEVAPLYNLKMSIIRSSGGSGNPVIGELLSHATLAESLRQQRLAASRPAIIWEVWLAVSVLSALFLALPPFFLARNRALHLILLLLLATALSSIFFIAVRLDDVFCGSTSVDLTPLKHIATAIERLH